MEHISKSITKNLQAKRSSTEICKNSQEPAWIQTIKDRYGEKEKLLVTFNPSKQSEFVRISLSRCFNGDCPSLTRVGKTYGLKTAVLWLTIQLKDLADYTGVKDKSSVEALSNSADAIIANYPYLKLTELMVFFQRMKAGKYDKFYGVVDPMVITTCLNTFVKIYRVEILEKIEKEFKSSIGENPITREDYDLLKWYFNY